MTIKETQSIMIELARKSYLFYTAIAIIISLITVGEYDNLNILVINIYLFATENSPRDSVEKIEKTN